MFYQLIGYNKVKLFGGDNTDTEALRRITYIMIIAISSLVLGFLALKYALPALLPFLIGWAVAFAVRPPAAYISSRTGISVRLVRPIFTVFILSFFLGLSTLVFYRLSREVWQIIAEFGEGDELRAFLDGFVFSGGIFDGLLGNLGTSAAEVVFKMAEGLFSRLGGIVTSLVASIPRVLLFVVVTVISTVYFAVDLERVNSAVTALLCGKVGWLIKLKNGFLSASVRYLRSYFLLFIITLFLVLSGFLLLRVRYAALLAFIIAFLDLLPVIGVGTFLIPYGVFEIVRGNTLVGIGILILFAVQTIVREVSEPKILGKSLGVHPLLTLVILYVGYALFGFFGIVLMPVFTVFAEALIGKKQSANVDRSGTC